ncbi:MAG: U32 family peptidase [Clostridia bacterium]|nr:U32 family peptidase [Clostridia bacterium]
MRSETDFLPELLSPAGSPEALAAAIEGGADAVYFGAEKFSARMRAKNFTDTELADAVSLCRAYGVRTYITVNTRLRDAELPAMMDVVGALYENGADALIMADLGAAALVRQKYPEMELHASTQLSGCSSEDARMLASLGFSRMVCPRELSLRQISLLCGASPIDIEMFIHGAHCVSYSGQCMLSYAMGGRSGNRGECAQPCRLPYRVCGMEGASTSEYPLSLKDMCLAEHIREVILSGAASLKIEGRQKSPDYVYGVTKMYRTLLDERRDATKDEMAALAALFSRDGFSAGYFRQNYRDMLGIRRADDTEMTKNAPAFEGLIRKVPLDLSFTLHRGQPASLSLTCGGKTVTVCGEVPEEARTAAVDTESARKNLCKFGGTPYMPQNFTADIDGGLFYTPAKLNALRRSAVDALTALPTRRVVDVAEVPAPAKKKNAATVRRTAEFLSPGQIPPEAEEFFDEIYLPLRCRVRDYAVMMPPYAPDKTLSQAAAALSIASPRSVLVHSPAQIALANESGIPAYASLRLNVFNARCAEEVIRLGASCITASPEIPLGAVRAMNVPRAVIAYGRLPLMLTLRCAISDGGKCCRTEGSGGFREDKETSYLCLSSLKDRTGTSFPLIGMYDCSNILYNSVPVYMADRSELLTGCGAEVQHFIFSTESKSEAAEVIRAYREGRAPADPASVRRIK